MTMRSKRLRGNATSLHDPGSDVDVLLPMDPSLMTERQQLAFLLRKTAQENDNGDSNDDDDADASSSSSSADGSSDDDGPTPRRTTKKMRQATRTTVRASPKSPPASSREEILAAARKNPGGLVFYCGRGRPPKNAIKLAPGEELPPDLKKLVQDATKPSFGHQRNPKEERKTPLCVQTDTSNGLESRKRKEPKKTESTTTSNTHDKTSPSSTNDLNHMQVFDEQVDFWNSQCALCCCVGSSQFDVAPMDVLFLCPTCDRKYPTQRALGLV